MRTLERLVLIALVASPSCTLMLGTFEDVGPGGSGGGTTTHSTTHSATTGTTSTSSTTGTTSTSTSSTSTSTATTCTTDADCPPTGGPCVDAACVGGVCGTTPVPANTPAAQQIAGDCKKLVCDGAGGATEQTDTTDLPVDGNVCTKDLCTALGPSNPPTTGTCASGKSCGAINGPHAGECLPVLCTDNVQEYGETDVDCGGSICPPCGWGLACKAGSDCESGTCNAGLCGAQQIAVGTLLSGLALDNTYVYWTARSAGTVLRAPKTGGTSTTIASGQSYPVAVTVVASNTVWISRGSAPGMGSVSMASTPGSPIQLLGNENIGSYGTVVVDGTTGFWTATTQVRRGVLGATAATTIGPGLGAAAALAVGGGVVYYSGGATVMSVPADGSGVATTLATGAGTVLGVAVDSSRVYWTESSASAGAGGVMAVPLAGGTPVTLAPGQAITAQLNPAVDATHVYFVAGTSIARVPIAGGPVKALATATTAVRAIAVDATHVYWNTGSAVVRVQK